MRKLLLLFMSLPVLNIAQQTYVPDDNFEAFLELNGVGNGIANDDYVTTANINTIILLDLTNGGFGYGISNLTGIEDFIALTTFDCSFNQITSLDVSNNTALNGLYCYGNQLTSIDVSNNTALTFLSCFSNQLTSLDVSNNTALTILNCGDNQITSLNVSNNTALVWLDCYDNQLTSLDVSNDTALTILYCYGNQLTCLNLKNGNNINMTVFQATNNQTLSCIEVDDPVWSTANWTNIDAQTSFSTNCNYPANCFSTPTTIQEKTKNINIYPNPSSDHVMIEVENIPLKLVLMDIQGKVIREEVITNKTHLMGISSLDKGIYFVRIGEFSSKLIVE